LIFKYFLTKKGFLSYIEYGMMKKITWFKENNYFLFSDFLAID